jgi:hypothetical protein
MLDAASTCETSFNFYEATPHNVPEDSQLHYETMFTIISKFCEPSC